MSGPVWAALDSRVRVEAPAGVLAALAGLLGPAADGAPTALVAVADRRVSSADLLDGTAAQEPCGDDPVGATLTALNRLALAQCADVAVHAAVVARGDRALALPGVSGVGKSTLAAACAQAGLAYVSDEALVLAADGRVRPYPRPVSLSAWSAGRLGLPHAPGAAEQAHAAAALGAVVTGPTRLVHVVVPRRGAGRPVLAPTGRAATAVLLLERSFNHYRAPAAALAAVAGACRGAQCWDLAVDDPRQAATVLADLLA